MLSAGTESAGTCSGLYAAAVGGRRLREVDAVVIATPTVCV